MIKVIKHGKTKFTAACSRCGCEFEYELKDLDISGKVKCPDCDQDYYHPGQTLTNPSYPNLPNIYPSWDPNIIKAPSTEDPCAVCPYRFGPRDGLGNPTVGDSPCQWCIHYKWKTTYSYCDTDIKNYNTTVTSTSFVTEDLKDVSK